MQQEWIGIKEKTPEADQEVLITDGVFINIDTWDGRWLEYADENVTHWMPLPEPPRRVVRKKILPEYFEKVIKGEKNFELRKDEDGIKPGDVIVLEEWNGEYTGRAEKRIVTYTLRNVPEYGLKDGYVIIGW